MTAIAARRIAAVSLTSANAAALAEFYGALGFVRAGIESQAQARVLTLRLGEQWLELATCARPGRPYPHGSASNDPWFQHFAIVVSSMQAAHARLADLQGWTPITQPAPQRLPASSGGVTAFKFRDPEGHPLELLEFPADRTPPFWRTRCEAHREAPGANAFLGIDHSAIVVASTERSLEFYEGRLGFTRTGGSHNCGVEQAHLDGLHAPDVEVTALAAAAREPPHLELLCYRAPSAQAAPAMPFQSCDVAATRLLIEIDDPTEMRHELHDPDGHALVLMPRG